MGREDPLKEGMGRLYDCDMREYFVRHWGSVMCFSCTGLIRTLDMTLG